MSTSHTGRLCHIRPRGCLRQPCTHAAEVPPPPLNLQAKLCLMLAPVQAGFGDRHDRQKKVVSTPNMTFSSMHLNSTGRRDGQNSSGAAPRDRKVPEND